MLKMNSPKLSIYGIPPFAVMKYQIDASFDDLRFPNMLHELTIGLILNELRETIPNFMFTLGGFLCSPPDVTGKSDDPKFNNKYSFRTLCGNSKVKNLQIMVLNEVIPAESDFYTFLKSNTDRKEICKILIQILYALYIAYKKFKFTHGDLHQKNILIVDRRRATNIEIQLDEQAPFFVENVRYVPVIIDYGFASAQWKQLRLLPLKSSEVAKLQALKFVDTPNQYTSGDLTWLLSPYNPTRKNEDFLNFAKSLMTMTLFDGINTLKRFIAGDVDSLEA